LVAREKLIVEEKTPATFVNYSFLNKRKKTNKK